MDKLADIHLGTSSFTADGWNGSFYPRGMKPAEYLSFYAERFDTVEIDSTFYACPSPSTVSGWARRTPAKFVFAVKVPQAITHEKVLAECDSEFGEFVATMGLLGEKLGPIVLQFPFFDRSVFKTRNEFLDLLIPFLKKLTKGHKFAVEIRNPEWLDAQFASVLRDFGVALVLQDQGWMPRPTELSFDPITTDWTYIRWLGDRKGIERMTKTWGKLVVDRTEQLSWWVDYCYLTTKRGVSVWAYANNHYAGHAPTTIQQFRELWAGKGSRSCRGLIQSSRKPPCSICSCGAVAASNEMNETQEKRCEKCRAALVLKPVPGANEFPRRLECPTHGWQQETVRAIRMRFHKDRPNW